MSAAAQSSGCALEGAARLETAQRGSCLANCCLASCAALEAASGLKCQVSVSQSGSQSGWS